MYNEHVIARLLNTHDLALKVMGDFAPPRGPNHIDKSNDYMYRGFEAIGAMIVSMVADESGAWEPELSILA